ncbi:hypothetical protein ACVWZK_004126 [Bradyrhizobium sp. GM0.4]
MNEQPHGPVNDRVRLMTFASMNSWFANRPTEVVGTDGKIKSVTWSKAWHQHPDRRQYDGVEFFPNPDGVPSTPNYLNLWRGFSVTPSSVGTCARFTLEAENSEKNLLYAVSENLSGKQAAPPSTCSPNAPGAQEQSAKRIIGRPAPVTNETPACQPKVRFRA